MSITQEEAIVNLEKLIELFHTASEQSKMVDYSEIIETLEFAAAALRPVTREQVEKMRATLEPTTLPDGTKTVATKCSGCGAHNLITHLFCWRCGSPLTDEAVDILAKRLEALKDGN